MASVPPATLRIGQVAAQLGLKPTTIRYYEDIGLLPRPPRTAAGYRQYSDGDLSRLHFIRKARVLGLHLDDIRTLLAVRDAGAPPCNHLVTMLDRQITQLDGQIETLTMLRDELRHLRTSAIGPRPAGGRICPVLEEYLQP